MIDGMTYYEILGLPKDGKRPDGTPVSNNAIYEAFNRINFGYTGEGSISLAEKERAAKAFNEISTPLRRSAYDRLLMQEILRDNLVEEMKEQSLRKMEENGITSDFDQLEAKIEQKIDNLENDTKEEIAGEIMEEIKEEMKNEEETEIQQKIEEKVESKVPDESMNAYEELLALTREEINKEQLIEDIKVENEEFQDLVDEINEEPVVEEQKIEQPVVDEPKDVEKPNQEENNDFRMERASALDGIKVTAAPEKKEEQNGQAEIEQPEMSLKDIRRKKILAGALIVFGGGLGGTIYGVKLMKEAKAAEKCIKGVRTSNSDIIDDYQRKLDEKTDQVLNKNTDEYVLEICKKRYEEQKQLLEKNLDAMMNQKVKRGHLVSHRLECLALENKINIMDEKLAKLEEKGPSKFNLTDRILASTEQKIERQDAKISMLEKDESMSKLNKNFTIKKLEVKQTKLLKRKTRLEKVAKFKSNVIAKFDNIKAHAKVFGLESSLYGNYDLEEETKTRQR